MRLFHLFRDPELRHQVYSAEKEARKRLLGLTPMQHRVMAEILRGHPNKVIGYNLGISQRTAENHRAAIYDRLEVNSFMDLIRLAILADLTLMVDDADVSRLS